MVLICMFLVMSNIFSCAYWPSVCLLWKNVYSALLPIFYCLLLWSASLVGKESARNAGDPISIPGLERSAREGIGYPLQYSWASPVAQPVKNPPEMQETWIQSPL